MVAQCWRIKQPAGCYIAAELASSKFGDMSSRRYARRVDPLLEFALLVKATHHEIQRRLNELVRPLGVTAAQAEALLVIGEAGPLSLKELGELLIAESGHPSRLVDRLVEADLVVRREADEDRRRVELSLSPRGRRLSADVAKAQGALLSWGRGELGGHDLGAATDAMRALVREGPLAATVSRRTAN
jgi:DNA-binding MarR family transcriptional regulator